MTRDDIIRVAQEAGIPIDVDWAGRPSTLVVKDGGTYLRGVDDLMRFAALVEAEKDKEIKRLQDMLYEQLRELTALRAEKQMRVHIEQLKEQPR